MEARLFALQRLTAMIMAPLVIIHLIVILYAVRGGLTAEEILARTQGSIFWITFYLIFVFAAAIHAPIGLRSVLIEWTSIGRKTIGWSMVVFAALLLILGLRAVIAITAGATP